MFFPFTVANGMVARLRDEHPCGFLMTGPTVGPGVGVCVQSTTIEEQNQADVTKSPQGTRE